MDWKKVAELVLEEEKKKEKSLYPPATFISFEWRGETNLGTLHKLEGKKLEGIIILSKPSRNVPKELIEEIDRLQPERPQFVAEDDLDLDGPYHILALKDNKIIRMSPKQTEIVSQWKTIDINGANIKSQMS